MRERRAALSRRGAAVVAMLVLLGATGFLPGSSPGADGAPARLTLRGHAPLGPGVDHYRYTTVSPTNTIHVVRVQAGAKASIVPVLSRSNVIATSAALGLETTSSMCRRANALACVNGDFTACSTCTAPLGGVIRHGEVFRSPPAGSLQLSVIGGRMTSGELPVSGTVTATYRSRSVSLPLTGVNVGRGSNGLVLYTPWYSTSTRAASGGFEVTATASGPALLNGATTLQLGTADGSGNRGIPRNGVVLSASGAAAPKLHAFLMETRRFAAELTSVTVTLRGAPGIAHSLGAHPVIVRQGQAVVPPGPADHPSRARHPRTLVGWNQAGDVWMVTIDGRQAGYSYGATFDEASAVLLQLGATEGMNLDGGGSTTFVAKRCDGAVCVRNRPSDGRERAVTTALAVVPRK